MFDTPRAPLTGYRISRRLLLATMASLLATAPALPLDAAPPAAPLPDLAVLKMPLPEEWQIVHPVPGVGDPAPDWLAAEHPGQPESRVWFGSRLVLQVKSGTDLGPLLAGRSLIPDRQIDPQTWILQSPDARAALREAASLSEDSAVLACHPVHRRTADPSWAYAPAPTDSWFPLQWPLEHRTLDGLAAGVDLNTRGAWPISRGHGVTLAIADTGVELNHAELAARTAGAPHFNFAQGIADGSPSGTSATWAHGTEAAGVAVASRDTGRVVGVAPDASLASWGILTPALQLATDEQLMDLYQYAPDQVAVQSHSWNLPSGVLQPLRLAENLGISNAVTAGREGRGSILVRSAGNDPGRGKGANANDDGHAQDPRVVSVAAVRLDGRVASYSKPGACLLVAAPSGDPDQGFNGLSTTDLTGTNGVNFVSYFPPNEDYSDYVYDAQGFGGTSAAAPQIAGAAALLLAARPDLGYRDIQHLLALAARHFDLADPDLSTNGAGFLVSHNLGFGTPDLGQAVRLALTWPLRPPPTNLVISSLTEAPIPDGGLHVAVTGPGVPSPLERIPALAGGGPHPDVATPPLPLVDVGLADQPLLVNLTNQGALILRGATNFAAKIQHAAAAGAAFAIIYNRPGLEEEGDGDALIPMGGTDFVSIPALFVGNTAGEELRALSATNRQVTAQLALQQLQQTFSVTTPLLLEHVGLRLKTDHPLRGDLRVTLQSPAGTRSILQRYNADTSAGPADWTYWSTHHLGESSVGTWTLAVSDQRATAVGWVIEAHLILQGAPLTDADADGLDDPWEIDHFGSLIAQPRQDPDDDGTSNAYEQLAGTAPERVDLPLLVDLSLWSHDRLRLSWPGRPNRNYEIWAGTDPTRLELIETLPSRVPETEWVSPTTPTAYRFFQVRTDDATDRP